MTDQTGGTVTQQVSYTYDALNQRLAKTVGAQTTRFVYDRGNVYLEFSGTNTTPSTRYLYGPMVDQVLAQESNGQTTWMLADHLGSVRDLVNNSGAVVNHFTYDSFGQVVGSTGTVDTRYKFTGREYDGETGLYYYRARYFDPGVGRFIGQDPMGFGAGDSNLYRYVGNSPIGYIDPSGLEAEIYVHSGGHWYGHVAINVNGKVYTFGRYSKYAGVPHTGGAISEHGDLYIVPEVAYLGNDKFTSPRDTVQRWRINLSTEEERSVVKFFESRYKSGIPEDFVQINGITYEGRNISRYVAIGESCITETLFSLPRRITELIANTPSFYGDIAGPSLFGGVPFDPQDLAGRLSVLSKQRNDVFQGLSTVKFKASGPR